MYIYFQEICTPRRAKIVTIVLAVVACILYSFALWTSGIAYNYQHMDLKCVVLPKYYKLVNVFNTIIDTTVTLFIPTVLIVWSNAQIIYVLAKFNKTRGELGQQRRSFSHRKRQDRSSVNKQETTVAGTMDRNSSLKTTHNSVGARYSDTSNTRSHMKVTGMLLTVSTVFLICNIPGHAIRWIEFILSSTDSTHRTSQTVFLVQRCFLFTYYINFSVNFILYAVSGKTFRQALCRFVDVWNDLCLLMFINQEIL